MKKNIEQTVIEKMEEAYGDHFYLEEPYFSSKVAGNHYLELSCDSYQETKIAVTFSKKLFGNTLTSIKDNYIPCVRSLEITSSFDERIRSLFNEEYRVLLSPGSSEETGTYSLSTPVDTLLREFDEFDEFFIISRESVSAEAIKSLMSELEKSGYKFTVHISGLVDRALFESIDVSYYDHNDPPSVGKQFNSIYYDNGAYILADD